MVQIIPFDLLEIMRSLKYNKDLSRGSLKWLETSTIDFHIALYKSKQETIHLPSYHFLRYLEIIHSDLCFLTLITMQNQLGNSITYAGVANHPVSLLFNSIIP